MLTGPLEAIASTYPWSQQPLEAAVLAFGIERVMEAAMRLEKAGTFARLDRQREDALAGALATYILAPPPAWPTESIFTPKATGAA